MYYNAVPPRAPPGSPAPNVVPGAASGVHDVLLLLPLFIRCSGPTAAAVHPLPWCCCYVCPAADVVFFC